MKTSGLAGASAHDALYVDLRSFVLSSEPGTRLASERDLSAKYGISIGSVRRALDRLLSESLINKAHGKGNFVAERSAASPRKTIIYIAPWNEPGHPFFMRRLRGVVEQAARENFRVQVVERGEHDAVWSPMVEEEIARDDTAGVCGPWITPGIYQRLMEINPRLKVVCFGADNKTYSDSNLASVIIDMHTAGHVALEHLQKAGARRIACLAWDADFEAGMEAARRMADPQPELLPHAMHGRSNPATPEKVAEILASRPDAFAFSDDRWAAEFIKDAQAISPSFPGQARLLSLANYGDGILPAGTIRFEIDGRDIGAMAAIAIRSMADNPSMGRLSIKLAPRLVE